MWSRLALTQNQDLHAARMSCKNQVPGSFAYFHWTVPISQAAATVGDGSLNTLLIKGSAHLSSQDLAAGFSPWQLLTRPVPSSLTFHMNAPLRTTLPVWSRVSRKSLPLGLRHATGTSHTYTSPTRGPALG